MRVCKRLLGRLSCESTGTLRTRARIHALFCAVLVASLLLWLTVLISSFIRTSSASWRGAQLPDVSATRTQVLHITRKGDGCCPHRLLMLAFCGHRRPHCDKGRRPGHVSAPGAVAAFPVLRLRALGTSCCRRLRVCTSRVEVSSGCSVGGGLKSTSAHTRVTCAWMRL